MQLALPLLISTNPSDSTLSKTLFTLWYIWKARNDNRFNRKTWSAFQVHQAAMAHMQTFLSMVTEHDEAGPTVPHSNQRQQQVDHQHQVTGLTQEVPQHHQNPPAMLDNLLVPIPSLLDGTRCYTDASTAPDNQAHDPRDAGLGIFIVNNQVNPPLSIFIKAAMRSSSSVLMAESAAMALAAKVLEKLQLQQATILSDNQQLVNFLNGTDLAHPPDWRIKPYTQLIHASVHTTSTCIRRINRRQNQMADSLASQALSAIQCNQLIFDGVCAHIAHDLECYVLMALNNVTINDVMVLTASCC
jgi:ribonuclease HI